MPRDPEARMTFTEHLGELRTRLIRCIIAIVIGFAICYGFSGYIFRFLQYPLKVEGIDWVTLDPFEGFIVLLKLGMYGAVLLASPYIIYQLCAFIFPGLKPNEKKGVLFLLFGGVILAIFGFLLAYGLIFPFILPYVIAWTPEGVRTDLQMSKTIAIIIKGFVAFAVAFQFPMVVIILVYLGLVEPATLKAYRKIVIIGITIASAILTPPDPFTMLAMMIPLVLLYEASIWLSYVMARRSPQQPDV